MNNFMEVFGDEKRYWLLPVSTFMGDGISYPTRINTTPSYNSMGQNNINNSNNAKLGECCLSVDYIAACYCAPHYQCFHKQS